MPDLRLVLPLPEHGEGPADWFSRISVDRDASVGQRPILGQGRMPYGWNMFELHGLSIMSTQPELVLLRGHSGTVDDGSTVFPAPKTSSAYAVGHWFGDCYDSFGTPASLYTTRYTWWQGFNVRKAVAIILGAFECPKSFSVQSAGTANRWPTELWAVWNGQDVGHYSSTFTTINQRKTFMVGSL